MHYHCEIVIPPTDDVEGAIESILKPYCEHDDDGQHAFWDFYSIGGRWSGTKLMAQYDASKLDAFHEWLQAEKVTVSGVTCGKQSLQPVSQIPKVDAKWNEMFPSDPPIPCPLFDHSSPRYGKSVEKTLPADVQRLADVHESLKCSHVIFAVPRWESKTKARTGSLEAGFMLTDTAWNGCNHMPVDWDGKFQSAVTKYREHTRHYADDYRAKNDPQDDWLVVTVDYHS